MRASTTPTAPAPATHPQSCTAAARCPTSRYGCPEAAAVQGWAPDHSNAHTSRLRRHHTAASQPSDRVLRRVGSGGAAAGPSNAVRMRCLFPLLLHRHCCGQRHPLLLHLYRLQVRCRRRRRRRRRRHLPLCCRSRRACFLSPASRCKCMETVGTGQGGLQKRSKLRAEASVTYRSGGRCNSQAVPSRISPQRGAGQGGQNQQSRGGYFPSPPSARSPDPHGDMSVQGERQ